MKRSRTWWRFPAGWLFFRFDDRLLLIFLGMLVACFAGLAAVALNRGLEAMFSLVHTYRRFWWAFVIPGIGAALSALFLEKMMKEGAGHGVPEVIYAVSRHGGLMRLRSSFSRLISGCLTIGSGGSAGPEAPVVMSGACIGSNIASFFSMNDRQRITLVGCGSAGALAAIFNAPIAGLVFTIEVIIGEWSARNIVPVAVAAVAGAQVSRLLQGNQIEFGHLQFFASPTDTIASVGLALVTAAVSILLTRVMRASHDFSSHITLPLWGKAAVGGFMVGAVGFFLPQVLGEGYHTISLMVEGTFAPGLIIASMLVLAKILATSVTLGWGGSGGIFAPCLVIGSFSGLMYYRLVDAILPNLLVVKEGAYVLLGMAGLISGILQAPLTGIFLIVEITGGYEVILPLILVSAISTTLCHSFEPASFYLRDLVKHGHFLRPRTDARLLADLSIRELVETDCVGVPRNMSLGGLVRIIKKSHRNFFPVEDEKTGEFKGMIHLDDIRQHMFDPMLYDTVFLEQLMDDQVETVNIDDDLAEVLEKMDANHLFSMPVVHNKRFVGMISKATLLDKYRNELMVQTYQ